MPEAILKFNLPEDQDEFEMASNGGKYVSLIYEVTEDIRRKLKYEGDKLAKMTAMQALEELQSLIYEELKERNLSLY